MGSSRNWFRLPIFYKPRALRGQSSALVAVHWNGITPHQVQVRNISSSGAYLLTDERWTPGQIVSLTLQRGGPLQSSTRRRITVRARAVRRDREGVAVSFTAPREGMCLWERSANQNAPTSEPEEIVREFRIAGALSFIRRISPEGIERARTLLRRGLSTPRVDGAVEIALHAEELLAMNPRAPRQNADPDLLVRILEDGSWADVEWIQHYWSGLLASSCIDAEAAGPEMECPRLLSQLTTMQARIFAASCDGAQKFLDRSGQLRANKFMRMADDLTRICGIQDRVHIERDVQHLADLELIEPQLKWKFFSVIDEADITPTPLALKLYARCHGYSGDPASFFQTSLLEESTICAD